MKKTNALEVQMPEENEVKPVLDEVVRQGAQEMLKAMLRFPPQSGHHSAGKPDTLPAPIRTAFRRNPDTYLN